jgi:hypothetical protein
MYTITIVSLDPGGDTGWTVARLQGKDRGEAWTSGSIFWSYGVLSHDAHHADLYDLLTEKTLPTSRDPFETVMICEGFDNRANPAADLVSLEYIGIAKLWAQRHPNVVAKYPSPSEKAFADDKKLKGLGLWQPGKRHTNDSTRHLVKYLCTEKYHAPLLHRLKEALHQ